MGSRKILEEEEATSPITMSPIMNSAEKVEKSQSITDSEEYYQFDK